MDELFLVKPCAGYAEQVMKIREEFLEYDEGFDGCSKLEEFDSFNDWLCFNEHLPDDWVPADVFLAVRKSDDQVVAILNFRHCLNDFLLSFGGHIGYSTRRCERRKGYAKESLRLVLEKCREMGLDKVLITCDRDNEGSRKTILACGGVMENEIEDTVGISDCGIIQRYWIAL